MLRLENKSKLKIKKLIMLAVFTTPKNMPQYCLLVKALQEIDSVIF